MSAVQNNPKEALAVLYCGVCLALCNCSGVGIVDASALRHFTWLSSEG